MVKTGITTEYRNTVKKRRIFSFIAVLYLTLAPQNVYAHFEDIGIGARQIGMGNTFTAIADDVNTIYYNPAGLDSIKWKEISLFTGRIHEGLSDNSNMGNNFAAFAYPLGNMGTVAVSWLEFGLAGYYNENTYTIGYAKRLKDPFNIGLLSVGMNGKFMTKGVDMTAYTENGVNLDTGYTKGGRDPVFENGYSISEIGIDLGVLYTLLSNPEHSFGLSMLNVNIPDMGFKDVDVVDRKLKIGYAYTKRYLSVAIDVSLEGDRSLLSVGSEHLFNGGIYGIRGGFNIGSDGRKSASMGAMYRYNDDFQFDYGFSLPIEGITSILGTHKLSITFRFGPSAPQLVDRAIEIKKHEKKIDSETEKIQRIKNKDELPRSKEILRKASEGNNVKREIKMSRKYYGENILDENTKLNIIRYIKDGETYLNELSERIQNKIIPLEEAARIDKEIKDRTINLTKIIEDTLNISVGQVKIEWLKDEYERYLSALSNIEEILKVVDMEWNQK